MIGRSLIFSTLKGKKLFYVTKDIHLISCLLSSFYLSLNVQKSKKIIQEIIFKIVKLL